MVGEVTKETIMAKPVTDADFWSVYKALHTADCPLVDANQPTYRGCRCGVAAAMKALRRMRDELENAGAKLAIVDPGWHCGTSMVECSLAGDCGGHETGAITCVEVNGEPRHYAKNERAAKRWAQRFARQHGGTIVDEGSE